MKFRKKPLIVEAVQWTGNMTNDLRCFLKGNHTFREGCLFIFTLEGVVEAKSGDWIIKGIKNELYPCKPDIFQASYELAEVVSNR